MIERITSLIKGGSVGSAAVVLLTGGYLWLQTMSEGVDSSYTMLLALSLILYYAGKKDVSLQQAETIQREPKRTMLPQQYPPPIGGYHGHPCNSATPNITITVNGEKSSDCQEAPDIHPEYDTPEKEPPELCFYRIYKDKADQYRWQLKTRVLNNDGEVVTEIIGTSHQGFKTPIQCLNEIYRVMECCSARIEEDIDGDGKATVVVPRPPPSVGGRKTPYVDRTNVLRQELLAKKLFKDINNIGD